MSSIRREWLFSIVIAIICTGLCFLDLSQIPQSTRGLHCRGRITAVDNSRVRVNLIVRTEHQFLTARLLDGPHKGQEISITNMLTGKMELDEFYEV
jgi:transposase-like protein